MIIRIAALILLHAAFTTSSPAHAQEAVVDYGPVATAPRLLVKGTTDISVFGQVLTAFSEAFPQIPLRYEQWASNALYRQADEACREGRASADLLISSAMDHLVKLVNDGCARPHTSALTEQLEPDLNWRDEAFGITREPAVMVYNRQLVSADEAPSSRFDLIDLLRPADSRFIGKVATYDIEQSGLGYLFAFADAQQATTFGAMLEAFGRTGAKSTCCSAEIIDAVAQGRYLIAYNMLGSYALARAATDPRIVVVAPEDYTLLLARAAMIPRASAQPGAAATLLDFLLSEPGTEALRRARLVISLEDADGTDLEIPGGSESVLRQIPLSPRLLVGLDQERRRLFIEQWRAKMD